MPAPKATEDSRPVPSSAFDKKLRRLPMNQSRTPALSTNSRLWASSSVRYFTK